MINNTINIEEIKGAIFDVDGTMLDSMWMWESVEADYLESLGAQPLPGMAEELRSLSLREVAEYFQETYGINKTVDEIVVEKNKMMEEFYFHRVMPKEGIVPVLEKLRQGGIKMCVATGTDRYHIEPALRRCGLLGYFGRIFTCSEENTSKSNPTIYLRAAEFLGTSISQTLVFEDALFAIKSAKGAGFPVAAVFDKSAVDQQEEIKSICDYYIESFV